ncbi:MAG: hypothetical protein GWN97_05325 [Thermoplasmata archaeon]|nr:hypothetical protein [Thermoplasmata archaeon]NIS11348.1 hypothetical protein [Thermoplasmata archaeon]NIT76378.1 hypothetical protein [Thermoplasmata archaeon]NIY02749.1 hypothetical protein [Thermoplasmata archaeon]
MLVLTIVPSGAVASVNVGKATVDVFAASVDADVPNPGNFNYDKSVSGTPVTLVLDCEVDDNNQLDNISTVIKIQGHLYNPSAPAEDDTTIWPVGRTATNQLSISFGNPPVNWFIDVQITADIYSADQDDSAHDEIEFRVTIV